MTSPPAYTYFSSLRRGLAAAITTPDTDPVPSNVSLTAKAVTSAGTAGMIDFHLHGPGSVIGLDQRVQVRTFPRDGETSHPPNLFATIELDRSELPWLFTPAAAVNDRLRPWLALVVVEHNDVNVITSDVKQPLPMLHVADASELPPAGESWAWAHVSATGDVPSATALEGLLTTNPERLVARLICPRRLDPAASYIAALVPTFDASGANLAAAWPATGSVDLPVFFSWSFSTGPVGDFRSLALLLREVIPTGAGGGRPMDITDPGGALPTLGSSAATPTLDLGGALDIPGVSGTLWDATEQTAFQQALDGMIDTANLATAGLGPPLYGRWLAAKTTVPTGEPAWLRELNQDPRMRVAAGLGAQIVQQQHEQLMAQAWAQVDDVLRANRALRQAQLARQHLRSIHSNSLPRAADGVFLHLSAPLHDRVFVGKQLTARGVVEQSSFPGVALSSAFRRLARPRGRFGRRLGRSGRDPGAVVERLASGALAVAPAPAAPDAGPLDPSLPALRLSPHQLGTLRGDAKWHLLGESDPVPGDREPGPDSVQASAFRQAAVDWATWLVGFEGAPQPGQQPTLATGDLRQRTAIATDPESTVPARTLSMVTTGSWTGAGDELEPVMAAPRFPQPMWAALRALSQQYVLPGIDTLEPNSITVAEPNSAFIEAFMVGLNHEIGRHLLFEEYPTDQRGTCFRQFWDPRGGYPSPDPGTTDDIDGIDGWLTGSLGAHLSSADLDMLVLLVRGELLHRYPQLSFYAVPAQWTGAAGTRDRQPDPDASKELYPLFRGTLAPDITFVTFTPLNPGEAKGDASNGGAGSNPGWYFVLQQNMLEAHYGLGAWGDPPRERSSPADAGAITWDDFVDTGGPLPAFAPVSIPSWWNLNWPAGGPKWGAEAASTAALTLQKPVRVAIHAAELLL